MPREQDRHRVLQMIRECEGGLVLRLDLRGIACDAQAHRTNAIRADARIVSGKGVREPVVACGLVASHPLGGERQHVRGLAREVRGAPAVVQGLELEILITELFADLDSSSPRTLALSY